MKERRRISWSTVLLVLIFFIGLGIMLYPTVSDYWNSLHQSRAIASYAEKVSTLDDDTYKKLWNEAVEYNKKLADGNAVWKLSEEEIAEYEKILDVSGTGIMGYIEIKKIGVALPIYHGVNEAVLQIAIGHLPGSSFPVGGESSHCVISGHRGLPSAKLFSDLDQLEIGDLFTIRVLDEVMNYEVSQIQIVLPEEMDSLRVQKGQDLMTLVTCTPYGINTHRLLVTGRRTDAVVDNGDIRVTADAQIVTREIVMGALIVPASVIVGILLLICYGKGRQERRRLKK